LKNLWDASALESCDFYLAMKTYPIERNYPSMFEPVHGSAPDIAGRQIANPIGQIWSGAMMLEHLGEVDAAAAVVRAVERVLEQGPRTRDIGGEASTEEVSKAIAEAV
jgi:tartrate dehydrogenase/decarboxylase/D-malate dehydrogenase